MKKDILTCDICGTIIHGPNGGPVFRRDEEVVIGVVPQLPKNKQLLSLDICEDDFPNQIFDGDRVEIFFGGTFHRGELIDMLDRDIVAVVVKNHHEQKVHSYKPEQLSPEQSHFIRQAHESMEQIWQDQINNNPIQP